MSEIRKLYLSDVDKKIAGVCGGMAEYLGIDSTIIRLLWLFSVILAGTGILAYIIAMLVIPRKSSDIV